MASPLPAPASGSSPNTRYSAAQAAGASWSGRRSAGMFKAHVVQVFSALQAPHDLLRSVVFMSRYSRLLLLLLGQHLGIVVGHVALQFEGLLAGINSLPLPCRCTGRTAGRTSRYSLTRPPPVSDENALLASSCPALATPPRLRPRVAVRRVSCSSPAWRATALRPLPPPGGASIYRLANGKPSQPRNWKPHPAAQCSRIRAARKSRIGSHHHIDQTSRHHHHFLRRLAFHDTSARLRWPARSFSIFVLVGRWPPRSCCRAACR